DDDIDDREAIRAALQAATKAGPGAVVALSPGEYRVGLSEQELREKPPQGKEPFNKRHFVHFDLKGADGVCIRGDGTRLLVTDPRAVLFNFQGSRNCVLSGISIDLDPLPFTQGEILSVDRDARAFDIKIPDGLPLPGEYPWLTLGPQADWQNRLMVFGVASPDNCDRARRGRPMLCYEFRPRLPSIRDGLSFEKTGPRAFRIYSKEPLAQAICPGNTLVYSSKIGGGPLIDAGGRNVRIEDVVVHASAGFVMSAASADNLQLKRFSTRLKPGRLVAGTSDGIHVRATRGGPLVEDCFFEGIQDDIFNISGNPLVIEGMASGTEIILPRSVNTFDRGRVAEGDTVYAYAIPEAKIKGEARVLRLDRPEGGRAFTRIILDRPIPGLLTTDMLYSREFGNRGAVIRNCTFRGGLRSAIMHMAGDGTIIEGNTFERMQNAIAIRQSAESSRNGQGGMVRNITIRNNLFLGCHMLGSRAHQRHPDAVIGVMLYPDSTSRQIENVVIENNRIFEPGLYGIWLSNVTGATVRNNEIIAYPDSGRLPASETPQRRSVRIHDSAGVVIDGILIREPRPDLAAGISIDTASEGAVLRGAVLDTGRAERIRHNDNIKR
ncbi:MAG: right-handed parallel beta-helix repeat-containing protein, partial [Opitutaceae bacterium]|nr:right-handed parallel beta-helix repeat-containing protein [Opitutaceae bacterium]